MNCLRSNKSRYFEGSQNDSYEAMIFDRLTAKIVDIRVTSATEKVMVITDCTF